MYIRYMKTNIIRKVAKVVREVCEEFICLPAANKYDFDMDLSCMCAVASTALTKVLRSYGIIADVKDGYFIDEWRCEQDTGFNHCWVECEDKIVDITATQFGVVNKVVITDKNNASYTKGITCNKYSDFPGWCQSQKPNVPLVTSLVKKSLQLLRKA